MLVLVAPHAQDRSKPSNTVAGELVVPSVAGCDCEAPCRCATAWFGIASGGATATAIVADRPGVRPSELRQIVSEHVARTRGIAVDQVLGSDVESIVAGVSDVTCRFAEGTVVELVGDRIVLAASSHQQ